MDQAHTSNQVEVISAKLDLNVHSALPRRPVEADSEGPSFRGIGLAEPQNTLAPRLVSMTDYVSAIAGHITTLFLDSSL
jgi:hypothetical protein